MRVTTATARLSQSSVRTASLYGDPARILVALPDGPEGGGLAWQRDAACRGLEAGIFYPADRDDSDGDDTASEAEAKAVCAACAVAGDCLEYAIAVREKDGIWGGQTAAERVRIVRRRRRAAARARNARAAVSPN